MAQLFTDWHQGIARSRADSQGFSNLINCDVHSEMGYISPQLALAADGSANVPTEPCLFTKTPLGTIYAFSTTTGKIWKYTGSWTAVTANTNTAHKGCLYYNGYVYYATSTKLGRFVAETETRTPNGTTGTGSTCGDNWWTFSNTSNYRPMEEVNLTLYIGNGKDVVSVGTGTGTGVIINNSALDCPVNFTVTALARVGVDLLIGTVVGSQVNTSSVFLWDCQSDSWTVEDTIPEVWINCFIKNDDILFAQCGTQGQLYYWNGSAMVRFRKIPGITTGIAPYNTTNVNGRCLFAAQGKVFSIHREDQDLPYALVQEYTATTGSINSLATYGSTLFASTGTIINKTGTDYANAEIYTPELGGNMDKVTVYYDSFPNGTSIDIATMIDNSYGDDSFDSSSCLA